MDNVTAATRALQRGDPVLLYDADGREEEVDMVALARHATPDLLRRLRQDAGGLVCCCVPPSFHQGLGLPFEADALRAAQDAHPVLAHMHANDLQYDSSPSSFGITVNHRSTRTGITDNDRAATIQALGDAVGQLPDAAAFGAAFRSPGHVHLLNGHVDGVTGRQGHTELSLELARQAGEDDPCTVICEMLGPDGNALDLAGARAYAQTHGLVLLDGADVLAACQGADAAAGMKSQAALGAA